MKNRNVFIALSMVLATLSMNAAAQTPQTIRDYENETSPKKVQKTTVVVKKPKVTTVRTTTKVKPHAHSQKTVVVVKKTTPRQRTYRVRAGDTLSHIAARNKVTVQYLINLNKLWGKKAHFLNIGAVIKL